MRHRSVWAFAGLGLILTIVAEGLAPRAIARAIDDGIAAGDTATLAGYAVVAAGLWLMRGLFGAAFGFCNHYGAQLVGRDLRNLYFAALNRMSFTYFDRNNSGDLITRGISDVQSASHGGTMSFLLLTEAVGKYAFFATLMLTTNFKLALATMAMVPIMVFWTLYFGRIFRTQWRAVMRQRSVLTDVLTEVLNGIRVVKAFAQEERETQRFEDEVHEMVRAILRAIRSFSIFLPALFFMSSIGTVVLIWYGFSLVSAGEALIGDVVSFNIYMGALIQPTRMMGAFVQRLINGIVATDRVFEIIDYSPPEPDELPPPERAPHGLEVVFDDVWFRYSSGADWILRGVSFVAPVGSTVGIIGPTGSGKTSLLNLLLRHYRPDRGRILIGGRPLDEFDAKELRWQVSAVPQDPYLFTNTVSKNVSFARPDSDIRRIEAAADSAQVGRFINTLPDRYETVVGERGVGLSGGQRQRVTIARALVMDAPILVMDDSTSSVDTETERLIQLSIDRQLAGRTALLVSQRVSSVSAADQILVLENGQITARGTHRELLEGGGLYAEIYRLQSPPAEVAT